MQADNKELFRLTAERTGKPKELYKDVGNFIFHKSYEAIRRPKTLIIKLRGIGSWIMRRKRMNIVVNIFPPDFTKDKEMFPTKLDLFKYENRVEIYELFLERLKDYERYIEERDELRRIRHESQKIIKPPAREE